MPSPMTKYRRRSDVLTMIVPGAAPAENATTSRARAAPVAPAAANTPTIMRRTDLTIKDLFAPDMEGAVAVFQGRSGAFAATRADQA
jgi:hypothetical protein